MLSEFIELAIACALFVAVHVVMSSTPIRAQLTVWVGQGVYLLFYSAVALTLFAWMVWEFRLAPYYWVWGSPEWARQIAIYTMPLAAMLVVAGYLTPNPSAVMGEYALKGAQPVRGIFQITRHPVMLGVSLWAAAHLLANGNVAGLLLFGSLLILAIVGIAHIEARRRASDDPAWQQFVSVTSIVPFAAIIARRTRFSFTPMDWTRLALGLGLYALLLRFHGEAFGVYLIGKP